jgi:hypothetical protein
LAGVRATPNPHRKVLTPDFTEAVQKCTVSGVTRFVGITLVRAGLIDIAAQILEATSRLAESPEERSSAIQELALLQQQMLLSSDSYQARKLWLQARQILGSKPNPWLYVNTSSGLLSITIDNLKSRPWLLLKIPWLFVDYKQDIETMKRETQDNESEALHLAEQHFYSARLRYMLLGSLGIHIPLIADWILQPLDKAHSLILGAKDIHLRSNVDLLIYRSITLARFGRCAEAHKDFSEISRLVAILNDVAILSNWEYQKIEIKRLCEAYYRQSPLM